MKTVTKNENDKNFDYVGKIDCEILFERPRSGRIFRSRTLCTEKQSKSWEICNFESNIKMLYGPRVALINALNFKK